MRQAKTTQTALSVFMTISIVAILLLVSPAQAVQLDANLPESALVGEETTFELKVDIEPVEQIPVDNITLQIEGPDGEQTCVFETDGTPISGCEHLTITPTRNTATYTEGFNFGYGYDGTQDINTFFGYGYGYGYVPSETMELVWEVAWDTTDKEAGDYNINYFISSSGDQAERDYVLREEGQITLEPAEFEATVTIKEGFPQDNNYVFECNVEGFEPTAYDWNFGDGSKLIDVENQNVWHTYEEAGDYSVTCVAADGDGNVAIGFTHVSIEEVQPEADLTLSIKEFYPQDNNYVFVCQPEGFEAESYDWFFGDGQAQFNSNNMNVYHTYEEAGEYTVTCVARDSEGNEYQAMLGVDVEEEDLPSDDQPNTCDLTQLEYECLNSEVLVNEATGNGCQHIVCKSNTNGGGNLNAFACLDDGKVVLTKQGNNPTAATLCVGNSCIGAGYSAEAEVSDSVCEQA